jgi:HlyD family secretion protein
VADVQGEPEVLKTLGVGKGRGARRWLVRVIVLLTFLGIVGGGVYLWRARANKDNVETYATENVERGDLRQTVTATGTLSPLDAVEVGAEVTGRVTKVTVDINDTVTVGQLLVELDAEQFEARVEESQAQLRSAQASFKTSKATIQEAEAKAQRTRELHKRGLASSQELETANAALERAKSSATSSSAQISLARAGLKSARTTKGKAIINSPIDGIVLARSVELGQTVTSGLQTPVLFTLAKDLNQMELTIDVDEADVGLVKEGQKATFVVDAYPKRTFSSTVKRLHNLPKAGSTVITYQAELIVDNSERLLRPGMTATATVVVNEKSDVLSVPNAALRFQPTGSEEAEGPSKPGLAIPGLGGRVRGVRGVGGPRRGGGARPAGGGAAPAGSGRGFGPRPDGSGGPAGERKDRGRVYIVDQGKPKAMRVLIGASDGRRTEVLSKELTPGTPVIVDVLEAKK